MGTSGEAVVFSCPGYTGKALAGGRKGLSEEVTPDLIARRTVAAALEVFLEVLAFDLNGSLQLYAGHLNALAGLPHAHALRDRYPIGGG
jgi:hypothetical protein